jgi:polyhydroxyalkanoate synthesis regulator protein
VRLIKKYPNHKHYDSEMGAYVSMRELGVIAVSGGGLKVVDDRTGADVTLDALARSLYDHVRDRDHAEKAPFEPSELVRLIRIVVKKAEKGSR